MNGNILVNIELSFDFVEGRIVSGILFQCRESFINDRKRISRENIPKIKRSYSFAYSYKILHLQSNFK